MTAPGDATTVGSIVAFLRMDRSQWNRDVDATQRDARRLGANSPDIQIKTNAADTVAQLAAVKTAEDRVGRGASDAQKPVIGLYGALAALAPAAVPIAAVTGGALLGLLPAIATVTLGIKGIEKDMKSGSLAGTQYGADLKAIGDEGERLQQIAAGGLLSGVDRGLANAHGLFGTVNRDIGVMSGQLGDIVAGAGPALLRILTQLDPLFVTIGTDLERGATALEHWSQNTHDVTGFVAYVQAELPEVLDMLGRVVVLFDHTAAAAAPFGGVVLHDISALVGTLDKIPVGVLEKAIPAAVSLYVALKAYTVINAIVAGTAKGLEALAGVNAAVQASFLASAATSERAALQVQAAAAAEAAEVAYAKAAEARSAADAAAAMTASAGDVDSLFASEGAAATAALAEMTAAFEGMDSLFASSADTAASAAAATAAALQAEADEAIAAATTIGTAAEDAAATSAAAGKAASAGWASMLGPVGAVIAGALLFTTALGHSSQAAQQAKSDVDNLTQAIQADNDALGKNARAQITKQLADAGALEAARKLGISLSDVTDAALGNKDALALVNSEIATFGGQGLARLSDASIKKLLGDPDATTRQAAAAALLFKTLGGTNSKVREAVQNAKDQASALGGATSAINHQVSALDHLNNALEKFTQNQLARAQSQDQFLEAVRGVTQQLKGNHDQLDKTSAKGLANRDAFLAAAQAALSLRDAQIKAGKSTLDADSTLAQNIGQLKAAAIAAGANKGQVDRLLKSLGLLPKDIRTKIGIEDNASDQLRVIQQHIDNLHGKRVVISTFYAAPTGFHTGQGSGGVSLQGNAAGGAITGPGAKGVDSVLRMLAPGEYVVNDRAVDAIKSKYGPGAMAMINRGILPSAVPTAAQPVRINVAQAAASGPSAAEMRAAMHGVRFTLDAPGVGTLTGHIVSVASDVARAEIDGDDFHAGVMAGMR